MNVFDQTQSLADQQLKQASEMLWLNANIDKCHAAGIEWLEVPDSIIKMFCKGEIPETGYMIYKNVKLCLAGKAEDVARREKLTCHEVLFPGEAGKMQVR